MATLADSLISSSSRPLRLRMRPDLAARRHQYQGSPYWVIKEPVGLKYFRFQEEEFAVLQMLDGQTSMEQIKNQFEQEFAPQKITFQDLQQFIGMLHRSSLVIGEAPGQGPRLLKRRNEQRRKKMLATLSNVFAVRWRGIDPEGILNWLYKYTWWLFTPPAAFFCLLLGFSALTLVIVQFDVFTQRLPTFHEFFGPKNWLLMAVVMGVVKILHEFGHGLSCKHFGGECHEMGFMLLVFTPALYCNVSDSWMLPNKWRRAFIGAAGMYVEMVIASTATFIWWFSDPSTTLNQVCLSVMFICSVSTLLFNGNPLLRFDGYYIMSDIVEIPNLRQKATTILRRMMLQHCLGIEQQEDPFLPKKNQIFLALYTVAAVCYRWIIVFSIMMFLNQVLEPYGLKILGQMLAMMGFFGLVVQPTIQLVKFLHVPGRMHQVKRKRVSVTLLILGAVLGVVFFTPFPHYVTCSLEIKPRDAAKVFVHTPGRLEKLGTDYGREVQAGDKLAVLRNRDLEMDIEKLQGEIRMVEAERNSLLHSRFEDRTASARIPQLEEIIQTKNDQLAEKEKQRAELQIVAPMQGVVLRSPSRPPPKNDIRLASWTGAALESKNVGALLQPGDEVCQIGDPNTLNAELVIDQADIEFVDEGQEVEIRLYAYPNQTLRSKIERMARGEMEVAHKPLTSQAGGDVAARTDPEGVSRPLSTSYQAWAPLEVQADQRIPLHVRGQARVYTGWRSLGERLWRYVMRTFHFHM